MQSSVNLPFLWYYENSAFKLDDFSRDGISTTNYQRNLLSKCLSVLCPTHQKMYKHQAAPFMKSSQRGHSCIFKNL